MCFDAPRAPAEAVADLGAQVLSSCFAALQRGTSSFRLGLLDFDFSRLSDYWPIDGKHLILGGLCQ